MISHDHYLISPFSAWYGRHDIVNESSGVVHIVVQVHDDIIRCRADIVVDTLVRQATTLPASRELCRFGTMSIQSKKKRNSIGIGYGDRRNTGGWAVGRRGGVGRET
jgi:hypothetical protein